MKKIFPFFLIILFVACQNEPSFEGIWLGNAYEMDKEVYVPIPRLMIANKDGSFNAYTIDQADSNWTNWEIKNKTLQIDTTKFDSAFYSFDQESFTFNGPFKAFFQRLAQAKPIDIKQFEQHLIQNTWESEFDQIEFKSDTDVIIKNKQTGYIEKACWGITLAEGHTFLIKKGNHIDCTGNYRFPELVISTDETQFKVKRWQNDSWKTITYNKVNSTTSDFLSEDFQLCNPYLYRGNPLHRYYYKGTFYKGGIYTINKLLNQFYKVPLNAKESGLIKIEFIVNCQGIPGRFSMMQFDEDYQLKEFSTEISEQIFEFTKSLKDWNAGQNDKKEAIDTYRFLTFRIKHGQVVEIFP